MILAIALAVSLVVATAVLVHQYRTRALVDADAPADDIGEGQLDERRAA